MTGPTIFRPNRAESGEPWAGDDWRDLASCRTPKRIEAAIGIQVDDATDLFFSFEEGDQRAAKQVCASCPVAEECDDFATVTRQEWGVWAGTVRTPSKARASYRRIAR